MFTRRVVFALIAVGIAFGIMVEAQGQSADARAKGARAKALRPAADTEEVLTEAILATDESGNSRLVMGGALNKGRQRRWWLVDRRTGEYVVVLRTNNVMNDAKRIQKIYRARGVEVSAERLALNLLPESDRLKENLRGLEARTRNLAIRRAGAPGGPLPQARSTPAVFQVNGQYSPDARLTDLIHRSAGAERCVPLNSEGKVGNSPSVKSPVSSVRLAQNGYLECYGFVWANIQTWELARYAFDVDHLNETYADAHYTQSYNGNLTYVDAGPSPYWTGCWANATTFIGTHWSVQDCIHNGLTRSSHYFDWAITGIYTNADFIWALTGVATEYVQIVSTASVTHGNGAAYWGFDYFEGGSSRMATWISNFFLSGQSDGDVYEGCEWICEPETGVVEECETIYQGTWDWDSCECTISPIVIDVNGDGLSLTSSTNGVAFDILATGTPVQMGWTRPGSDDAFLALDRNGNGHIEDATELFGTKTAQPVVAHRNERKKGPNGFLALAVYDEPSQGGNKDGLISAEDWIYSELRLWTDSNHNGISEATELVPLSQYGIRSISLKYIPSKQVDQFGNALLLWSHIVTDRDLSSSRRMQRRAVDVNFVFQRPASAPLASTPQRRVL